MNYNCDLGHKSDKQLYFHKLHVYLINPEENLKIYSNGLYKLGVIFSSWILTCVGNTITAFMGYGHLQNWAATVFEPWIKCLLCISENYKFQKFLLFWSDL